MAKKKGTEVKNKDAEYVRNSIALDKRQTEVKILDGRRGDKGVEILDKKPKQ
jgi:hypothetical protein